MNAFLLLAFPPVHTLAQAPASNPACVSLTTVLLVLGLVALLVLGRLVENLRARIAALERTQLDRDKFVTIPQVPEPVTPPPPAAPPAPAPLPVAAPVLAPQPTPGLTTELLAVITAAVHVACGPQARVAGIIPVPADDRVWSLEGRRQIFDSHKVR